MCADSLGVRSCTMITPHCHTCTRHCVLYTSMYKMVCVLTPHVHSTRSLHIMHIVHNKITGCAAVGYPAWKFGACCLNCIPQLDGPTNFPWNHLYYTCNSTAIRFAEYLVTENNTASLTMKIWTETGRWWREQVKNASSFWMCVEMYGIYYSIMYFDIVTRDLNYLFPVSSDFRTCWRDARARSLL